MNKPILDDGTKIYNDGNSFYLHAFNPKDCKLEVISRKKE